MSAEPKPVLSKPTPAKVRVAMHLFVARPGGKPDAKVTVTEERESVTLTLDVDGDGIGAKSIRLTLLEAAKLSDHLNLMRRRVLDRKPYLP